MSSGSGFKADFEEARAAAAEEAAQLRAESLRQADEDARHEAAARLRQEEAARAAKEAARANYETPAAQQAAESAASIPPPRPPPGPPPPRPSNPLDGSNHLRLFVEEPRDGSLTPRKQASVPRPPPGPPPPISAEEAALLSRRISLPPAQPLAAGPKPLAGRQSTSSPGSPTQPLLVRRDSTPRPPPGPPPPLSPSDPYAGRGSYTRRSMSQGTGGGYPGSALDPSTRVSVSDPLPPRFRAPKQSNSCFSLFTLKSCK
jgi:hypothetical protein